MTSRRLRLRLIFLVSILVLGGCVMPTRGTPVFVDMRAGNFWSGRGLLLEVDEAERRCRVAVRDKALVVRKMWIDCASVHAQTTRT